MARLRSFRVLPRNGDATRPESLWERRSSRSILLGLSGLLGVIAYGVIGYVMLGWRPFDAFYMVIITISGVGFGEVRSMVSTTERIHTMLVIGMGVVAFACTVGGFVALLTEGEVYRALGHQRMRRQIEGLTGHTIIAGFGRIGALVSEELTSNDREFVVIERAADRIAEIERRGYLFVQGNATDESILAAAGVTRAKVLVCVLPNDADNVFVTLMAKQLLPAIEIISRAEQHGTLKTLRQAGASHVVMPAAIGAHRIASLLTNPSAVEFAEVITHQTRLSLEMDEIPIPLGSSLVGQSIAEAGVRVKTNAIVVAMKRLDGTLEYPANVDTPVQAGDIVVLLGRRSNLEIFRKHYLPA
jgi:voltage-gated potassium channel